MIRRSFGVFVSCVFLFSSGILKAQETASENLDRLYQKREMLLNLLDRVEQGAEPCFSPSCQNQKTSLIHSLHRKLERLPHFDSADPSARRMGIITAHRLVANPYIAPASKKLSIGNWVDWWRRRYIHDLDLKSNWMNMKGNLGLLRKSIRFLVQLQSSDRSRQIAIQNYWDQGLGAAAANIVAAVRVGRKAEAYSAQGDETKAEFYRSKVSKHFDAVRRIEKRLGETTKNILRRIFPELEERDLIVYVSQLHQITKEFGSNQLFDPELEEYVSYFYDVSKDLYRDLQDFTDLEYGVIGLENFYTETNPIVALDNELQIQQQLDVVDGVGRTIVDLATFYIMMKASYGTANGSRLLGGGLTAFSTYASLKADFDFSEILLSRSNRTSRIRAEKVALEAEIADRRKTLLQTQELLLIKIEEINEQIDTQNANGG